MIYPRFSESGFWNQAAVEGSDARTREVARDGGCHRLQPYRDRDLIGTYLKIVPSCRVFRPMKAP